jgi:hypothetical protein
MPKDDGLVADVQSRARGALYNWNRPFTDQSVAYYRARHHARAAPIARRYSRRKRQLDRGGQTLTKLAASAADAVAWLTRLRCGRGGKLRRVAGREAAPVSFGCDAVKQLYVLPTLD